MLSVRGQCFPEKKNTDYYIHLILTPLFSELREEEKIKKKTHLLSNGTMRFFRQKLLIIEVKIIYQEISSGIASLSPRARKFETLL